MSEGPVVKTIPQQSYRVCEGCKYLNKEPVMRGHKSVTNNFTCTHPNFENERILLGSQKGRTIHFNHEGDCTTPDWCPYLQNPISPCQHENSSYSYVYEQHWCPDCKCVIPKK